MKAKYLGLSENIKVRRAGFAYRAEYHRFSYNLNNFFTRCSWFNFFHRFLERFNLLSEKTYPEWRGTDMNGCKEIIK